MVSQSQLKHLELVVADDPAVALLGLNERSGSPPQGHRAVLPVRHPAGLLPHAPMGAVDQASSPGTFLAAAAGPAG